jgi:hypothetical protein
LRIRNVTIARFTHPFPAPEVAVNIPVVAARMFLFRTDVVSTCFNIQYREKPVPG